MVRSYPLAFAAALWLAAAVAAESDAAQPPPPPESTERLSVESPVASAAEESAERLGTVRGDTLNVTLGRVIAAALDRNEMLAASSARQDAAGAEALGAWRAFLPRITLGEFFLRSDDALSSFGYKLNNRSATAQDFDPARLNFPGESNNYVTQIRLQQPIFNGGAGWNGKAAANAASRARSYEHRRARETVVFQAVQAVEGLALAEAFEDVVRATLTAAEQHVHQAEAMVEAEMATQADLLQAQVFLAGVESRLIEARNQVEVAGENIKLLTATDTPLVLSASVSLEDHIDAELPAWPDSARLVDRADLRASLEQARAAGKLENVARGALLPHVNLTLERNWYSREDLFGTDARAWSLGVYATWDIFAGLENLGALKKARAERRAAEHQHAFASRQARVEARQAWLAARAARERVDVARRAVVAANDGLRIVRNQYREGLATMLDLLETQVAATRAETGFIEALHDFNVGLARLRYSGIGRSLDPAAGGR
jgi:outer membrane protein TolC